jgi:transposase-like protein
MAAKPKKQSIASKTCKASKKPEEQKPRIGRPPLCTPEKRAAIIDAISHRIPYEFAAEGNGVCEATLYNWLICGRRDLKAGLQNEYTLFLEDVKRAEMTRIRQHSDIIAERPERWQADAWLLERRWHKHYGPNAQLNELNRRLDKIEQQGDFSNEEQKGHEETSDEI